MSINDLSLLTGLSGTFLLAIAPLRVELIRFSNRELNCTNSRNEDLSRLVSKAEKTKEHMIAKWTIIDSIIVFLGILLLMASYLIPLFLGAALC